MLNMKRMAVIIKHKTCMWKWLWSWSYQDEPARKYVFWHLTSRFLLTSWHRIFDVVWQIGILLSQEKKNKPPLYTSTWGLFYPWPDRENPLWRTQFKHYTNTVSKGHSLSDKSDSQEHRTEGRSNSNDWHIQNGRYSILVIQRACCNHQACPAWHSINKCKGHL